MSAAAALDDFRQHDDELAIAECGLGGCRVEGRFRSGDAARTLPEHFDRELQRRFELLRPDRKEQRQHRVAQQAGFHQIGARKSERGHLRSRTAHPNWPALNELRRLLRANPGVAQEIEVPVFADKTLVLSIDRMESAGQGIVSFSGRVAGEPLSSAVIVDANGTFALHVNQDDTAYQVTLQGDEHAA